MGKFKVTGSYRRGRIRRALKLSKAICETGNYKKERVSMQFCEFSETQFAFCYTFEHIRQHFPFVPLPISPNTVQEGRTGGGYDVQINGNLYFQFKIPAYHDLVSNFFRKHWDVFGHEYYKIKLDTDSEQFRLLKDLQSPTNNVYYATPEFHTSDELGSLYGTDNIVNNSALFAVENFPGHGSGHHHLIYSPEHPWGRLFSEPTDIKKSKLIHPLELFTSKKAGMTIYGQAGQIHDILRRGQYETVEQMWLNDNKPDQFVKDIYTVLLTKYNIHWYPIIST